MKGKIAAFNISLMMVISLTVIIIEVAPLVSASSTLYVGGSGIGNYSKIQWAIENVSDGDTVFVYNGTYYENVVINKGIDLIGEDRETTIIDGGRTGNVVNITHNGVKISEFSIRLSGNDTLNSGIILLYVSDCVVLNNTLTHNYFGITLEGSTYNSIINNEMYNNYNALFLLYSDNNNVSYNTASYSDFGIYLYFSFYNLVFRNIAEWNNESGISVASNSGFNTVLHNRVCHNLNDGFYLWHAHYNEFYWNNASDNVDDGIYFMTSRYNEVENNTFINNSCGMHVWSSAVNNSFKNNIAVNNRYGVYIFSSDHSTFNTNWLSRNERGIYIRSSEFNSFNSNTISLNTYYGIYLSGVENNSFVNNNIISNDRQAYDNTGLNLFNATYPTGGNYWSDYSGLDEKSGPNQDQIGSDGIGDTPYMDIYGGSGAIDYYPLMEQVGYSILLYKGWNFISIPLIQSDPSLDLVLSSIKGHYDAVQFYNADDGDDHWKHHHEFKPPLLNDLNTIDNTKGFWIHITIDGGILFECSGTQPTSNTIIPVYKGWNMMGYPSLTSYMRTEGLNNLQFGPEIDAIQWFDANTRSWHFLEEGDNFVPGRGYWFHSNVDTTWEVPL